MTTISFVLRRFLYLDADLVSDFLGQAEGGTYSEESLKSKSGKGRGIGGGIGAGPLKGQAEASSAREQESTRTVAQTPESEFTRLLGLLEQLDEVRLLDEVDEDGWGQLRRGEILEIEAEIKVPTLTKFMQVATDAGPMIELMQAFGEGDGLDAEAKAAMQGLSSLDKLATKVPTVAEVAGSPGFAFFAPLERKGLRVELGELEGEATLAAKIQRKLKGEESISIIDTFPGFSSLPAEQRAEIQKSMAEDEQLSDGVVAAPAAVVTPIAIYR